jgi:hypothetical protein
MIKKASCVVTSRRKWMRQNASTANCHCNGRGEEEYSPYIFWIICLIGPGSANKLSVYVNRLLPVIYDYRLGGRWQKAELTLMICCWYRYLRPFNGFRSFIFRWQCLNPRNKRYNFQIFSFSATEEGGRSLRFTHEEDPGVWVCCTVGLDVVVTRKFPTHAGNEPRSSNSVGKLSSSYRIPAPYFVSPFQIWRPMKLHEIHRGFLQSLQKILILDHKIGHDCFVPLPISSFISEP